MSLPGEPRLRGVHWLGVGVGLATLLAGVVEVGAVDVYGRGTTLVRLVLVALVALAAALYRRAPGAALALSWCAAGWQVQQGLDFAVVELALLVVAYGTARYGAHVTVWLSGLSVPAGALLALVYARDRGTLVYARFPFDQLVTSRTVRDSVSGRESAALVVVAAVLAAPWVLGLLLRLDERYRSSDVDRRRAEAEAARAQEMAELRAGQANLARDVHDIVGHSLAVIVAQADSAQYLRDDEIDRVRQAMATIAASARQSLGDVRQVLSSLEDAPRTGGAPRELDSLPDGIRDTGHELRSVVSGVPGALDGERDVVAYRVLQEMLTNALRHGSKESAIDVHREWSEDALVLRVCNRTAPDGGTSGGGRGLPGMKQRLESVGGTLDVARTDDREGATFTATARIPLAAR
ncbi:signal transduction histidine kinase [Motilibacter peucedani]|uniref:histidine kinase n=1 Tax=Motilibacter peucedani TaxID=598650 RepID=A0A420XUK6_9ACTN|nr:histidine kinase [Motilibacter peucedani]RKS80430.1 signal transduction histidine kinase [Motilibacter peucedani]